MKTRNAIAGFLTLACFSALAPIAFAGDDLSTNIPNLIRDQAPRVKATDSVPSVPFFRWTLKDDGSREAVKVFDTRAELSTGRVLVVFVPGADTPTCTDKNAPQYIENIDALRDQKGIAKVVFASVDKADVALEWMTRILKTLGGDRTLMVKKRVELISDATAKFTLAMGLGVDMTLDGKGGPRGLYLVSRRTVIFFEDGIVQKVFQEKEDSPGAYENTQFEKVFADLPAASASIARPTMDVIGEQKSSL